AGIDSAVRRAVGPIGRPAERPGGPIPRVDLEGAADVRHQDAAIGSVVGMGGQRHAGGAEPADPRRVVVDVRNRRHRRLRHGRLGHKRLLPVANRYRRRRSGHSETDLPIPRMSQSDLGQALRSSSARAPLALTWFGQSHRIGKGSMAPDRTSTLDLAVTPPWRNPECTGINRLPTRATMLPYAGVVEARACANPRILSLDCHMYLLLLDSPEAKTSAVPPSRLSTTSCDHL